MISPLEGVTSFSIIGKLMTRGNIGISYTYYFRMSIWPRTEGREFQVRDQMQKKRWLPICLETRHL